jgi:FAD synthase
MYGAARDLASPLLFRGPVVKGFGRGSKELGVPTANLDVDALGAAAAECEPGVYFGWASVGDSADVHKMVMSIGW